MILFIDIIECILKVCRIKYFEKFMIFIKDSKGKEIGEKLLFEDLR